MKLEDIKKSYSHIYSLGSNCATTLHLKNRGLRAFSGVLDWMSSPKLSDVNRLLTNRFDQFLRFENLSFISYYDDYTKICIRDDFYNVYSCHDFTTDVNTPSYWPSYTLVKEKYDRRIERFLNEIETSDSLLFVRVGGTYKEAFELENILSRLIKHQFCVLLIVNSESKTLIEEDWGLKQTCVLKVRISKEMLDDYNYIWDSILGGITLARLET